jgi:hypothetical protein
VETIDLSSLSGSPALEFKKEFTLGKEGGRLEVSFNKFPYVNHCSIGIWVKMLKSMLVLCAIMWLPGVATVFGGGPPTEPWKEEEIYNKLTLTAAELSGTNFGKSHAVAGNLDEIKEFAKILPTLFDPVEPGQRNHLEFEYLLALTVDAWEMENVVTSVRDNGLSDSDRLSEQISDVRDDLAFKYGNAAFHGLVGGGDNRGDTSAHYYSGESISVEVTTRDKDGKEVQNCEVWFCLKGLLNYKDRYDHFDRPSSPTTRSLLPGNYVFWTQMGSAEGARVPLKDFGIPWRGRKISIPAP